MANIADLKNAVEELTPVVKELFRLAALNADRDNKAPEHRVVEKLRRLASEADNPTAASLQQRAETIGAARSALTEILVQALSSDAIVPETTLRLVRAERTNLRSAFADVLVLSTFEDIPALLRPAEVDSISASLTEADREIRQRQKASDILQSVINVAIKGAEIAVKLA